MAHGFYEDTHKICNKFVSKSSEELLWDIKGLKITEVYDKGDGSDRRGGQKSLRFGEKFLRKFTIDIILRKEFEVRL